MSIDNRTAAEIAYDSTRLSPLTTAEKRALARQADEALAAHFQPTAVTSARWALDDELDERHGEELGTDYECGRAGLYIPDDTALPLVFGFEGGVCHELDQQGAAELLALLESPRMRAHLTRWFANAPTNPSAVTDTRTSAYKEGRKDGMEEGFTFGYSKALDQVEQYLKERHPDVAKAVE